MKYFVERKGDRHGPYSVENLREFLKNGNVDLREAVFPEDGSQPLVVGEVLNPSSPSPNSPATPSPSPSERSAPTFSIAEHLESPRSPVAQKPKSNVGMWIAIVVAIVVAGGAFALHRAIATFNEVVESIQEGLEENALDLSEIPLLEDRKEHVTDWQESSYENDGALDSPPTGVFEIVRYPSPAGDLAAYLTPDPGDGKRHPVMVWAKGGFGGVGSFLWEPAHRSNDQSAAAFRKAGIVLMCPSWRGENDNPGRFEMFFGEVDDFLAAIAYVKTLPWVDPERVYIGGHSTGGSISLLAAVAGADVRATFSFGGEPDLTDPDIISTYDIAPYDTDIDRENELRSSARYTAFIQSPTFFFEGGDYYPYAADLMAEYAESKSVPFQSFHLPGNHFDILRPTTELIAKKILSDTETRCDIAFTDSELEAAYEAAQSVSLSAELRRWRKEGGNLEEMLEALGEVDSAPADTADVRALRDAIRTLTRREPDAAAVADLAILSDLGSDIENEGAVALFSAMVIPELRKWVGEHLRQPTKIPTDAYDDALAVLRAIAWEGTKADAEVVGKAALSGFGSDSLRWSSVFSAIYTEDEGFGPLIEAFAEDAPGDAIGSAIVERANRAYLDDEWEGKHPYDNPAGAVALSAWLDPPASEDDDTVGAFSAALALAFVSDATRGDLTTKAMAHPDLEVQLEAAYADVKSGGQAGISFLTTMCTDLANSLTAQSYLRELEHEDAIPASAKVPEFAATAEMVSWLKHPNELGSPPPSIELFDRRELFWPPVEKKAPLWLFKFTYFTGEDSEETVGYGMVGGMTWSSFIEYETPPSPAELYLHHCRLELNRNREDGEPLLTESEIREKLAAKNSELFR